jgi:general secretion pathway protein A
MYNALFGLSQEPFSIAPDPRFLYMSERHREALAHLLYGVQGGGGFVLLTGAVGAGKTTVCRCFVEQLPPTVQLAYVFNPMLGVRELLATICDDFGIEVPAEARSVKDYVDPLNQFLLGRHATGSSCVLVIDEAQNLAPEVLEQLRLLTNLETDSRKLLQIILIGQPELRDRLAEPGLEQVAQRVIARYHLEPLDEPGTAQYVRHRLGVAGLAGPLPFDAAALRRVHRHTRGVPRRINLLCDRALLGAYAQGRRDVTSAMVDQAAREVFDERPARRLRAPALVVGLLAGAAAAALTVWAWPGLRPSAEPGVAAVVSTPARPPSQAAAGSVVVTPPAAAPGASAVPALRRLDAAGLFAEAGWSDEAAAWRALATRWGVESPAAGEPCAALAGSGLACHRGPATLALIRQLDRPGWLPLQLTGPAPVPVLLMALDDREATLLLPGGPVRVSLATLASRWGGEFATLWRPPPGDDPSAWMLARLAEDQAGVLPDGTPLRPRIEAFQRAQGLKADGLAGPLTQMQLNRVAAVAEPRLTPER